MGSLARIVAHTTRSGGRGRRDAGIADQHDPEDRTATGTKVKYLYCPDCGRYSGGGLCRVCQRGLGEFVPPKPKEKD